ncbi:MAG: cbb3-type cytochrome c oxidase subunit 3 [Alphaproteobacteria bacterium]|nr:cbb3-type cytochrome c oxidase subunit 3 [Alphaproteobacteria bacterium]
MESIYPLLKGIGTAIMMLGFLIAVGYALWPSNRERFERDARIPFSEDR